MFFLNKKEKKLARHNKKVDRAQTAYNNDGKCCTCKYARDEDIYYDCRLHFTKPGENEMCSNHVYSNYYQKAIDYVEKDAYKEFFNKKES